MDELKPCPFCGSEAKVFYTGKTTFYIGCTNGCAKTKRFSVMAKREPVKSCMQKEKMQWAVKAWNTRTPLAHAQN